jgi:hypothetical protein
MGKSTTLLTDEEGKALLKILDDVSGNREMRITADVPRLFGELFPHHKGLTYKVLKSKIDNLLKDPAKKNTVSNVFLILKLIFLLLELSFMD